MATPYWRGVDASFVPQYRSLKTDFFVGAKKTDALTALAESGSNLLRLRVWVNPTEGFCNTEKTLEMARDGKKLGMQLLLDFHYSDWWADPGHQVTPKAWEKLDLSGLEDAVELHSKEVVSALVRQGTPPVIVQIGNEVRAGMLWPLGQRSKGNWDNFATLLKAGIRGTKAGLGKAKSRIMIHNDAGGEWRECSFFYRQLQRLGVKFDMIGLSYYPWWHGPLTGLAYNLNRLGREFSLPLMVVETAYPFTLERGDDHNNFVWQESQLQPGFSATPEGQAAFLTELHRIVKAVPGGLGAGVVYWAPEYVAAPYMPTPYENLALFDLEHRLLPGASALGRPK
jgi:arabinogalactan endo-1,4-beta-galactosidase